MVESPMYPEQELLIREALEKLERRSSEIRLLVYSNPSGEILSLRKAVDEKIVAIGYEQALPFIEMAAIQERKLLAKMRMLKKRSSELLLELIGVDLQIDDLKKELCRLHYPQLINIEKIGEFNEAK